MWHHRSKSFWPRSYILCLVHLVLVLMDLTGLECGNQMATILAFLLTLLYTSSSIGLSGLFERHCRQRSLFFLLAFILVLLERIPAFRLLCRLPPLAFNVLFPCTCVSSGSRQQRQHVNKPHPHTPRYPQHPYSEQHP